MNFLNILQNTNFGQILGLATITDVLDVVIVAALLYYLYRIIRNTAAARLLKGVVVFLLILMLSGESFLNLRLLNYILTHAMQLGAIALVVVFQPELRRILEQLGRANFHLFKTKTADEETTRMMIVQTVEAVSSMAWSKTGALIVFETGDSLEHVVSTGTTVNADMTAELIKNVFYPKAPLHDGAMIVKGDRMQAAGCILPLTGKFGLSKELGTRHRAAIGVTENYDCIVVVVSEETGSISFAKGGQLKRHLAPETLERMLMQELMPEKEDITKNVVSWIKGVLRK